MQLTLSGALTRAVESFQAGHMDQAEALCRAILRADAGHLVALHLLAAVQTRLGRLQDALASYDRVLAIKPDYPEALNNRGTALHDLHRFEDALASYERALAIKPDYVEALNNRGNALRDLKRCEAALASYDQALAINPGRIEALINRGITLQDLGRFEDALASLDTALAVKPDHVEALFNHGIALQSLRQFEAALTSYGKALAIKPDHVETLINRGNMLRQLKRLEESLASYDSALAIKSDHVEALINRGNLLRDLKRAEDALTSYGKALAIMPDHVEALICRGAALRALNRFDHALASYERALAIEPRHRYAFPALADCALNACDWTRTAKLEPEIRAHVEQQKSVIMPFTLLAYCSDASLQLKCARSWIADQIPGLPQPLWDGTIHRHQRVRIAYLSADYYHHATAYLTAELFELHDRSRFEVLGVSFGGDDASDLRARLASSFDHFYDVTARSDEDAAKLLASLQVDIAVDLKGYTQDARTGILAHRPAPVQINYLGYPGTMGASFMDYVIADATVLPFDQQSFYTEKIIHLPDCYQVNDSRRAIAERTPSRREAGLPMQGFVFCCFNNNYKIRAPVFEVWMRLLCAVPGSVLWLLSDNTSAHNNLRRQAAVRAIDPARLVFADRLPLDRHLARHRLADLFLDTLPYNAHTTASDALWAGLPVLSCRGASFAGRVAASLLNAVGLPELVTGSLQEYEAMALKLATDASLLGSIRRKLAQNRLRCPLFDTDRFRRHIEAAYLTAWEIWQRGEPARSFSISSHPPLDTVLTPGSQDVPSL